ncbi:TPA: hypothetical protein DIC20_04160 [Candidatus Dependentiae bacterium]|nr:MAG: hypothetical protein US03_C0004G0068 [candidate division TM6 bacterium GW2011_GWF2_36_131]KKQ03246.1 MAG: hypothetical protein US13_C0004G0068 [candidate division TM6 bacterium GW2011_GWE2_36_25]KKQ19837.1 MAG: hypothetical protein US32_C0004G0021 [candidate division TM6 bacterium GW2011_GWA2_36_9]HBR70325.1 hypothetical protein [Candidatus Dependentiae bacterium]HCU00870.1 hypothetical protein [Candidatus Dependentiae bacterium]
MLKNDNAFRDFLFAVALIGLIRLVYQERAAAPIKIASPVQCEKEGTLDVLLKNMGYALEQSIEHAKKLHNLSFQKDLDELKNQWKEINQQYNHKIKQEDAVTYFLGPIYSMAKVSKEHLLKNQLNKLQDSFIYVMQQHVDILQENNSSYIASVQM